MTVTSFRCPDLEKVMSALDHQIALITGKIKRVYTLDGQRVENVEQLEHRKSYVVVAGDDPFQRIRYNINAPQVLATAANQATEARTKTASIIKTERATRGQRYRNAVRAGQTGDEKNAEIGENTHVTLKKVENISTSPTKSNNRKSVKKDLPLALSASRRPSVVTEEQDEKFGETQDSTGLNSRPPSPREAIVPNSGKHMGSSHRAATLKTAEQRHLANKFQTTYKSIRKQLSNDHAGYDQQQDKTSAYESRSENSEQNDGDSIDEEDIATAQGDERISSREGVLKHFAGDERRGMAKKKIAPGPQRRDDVGEHDTRNEVIEKGGLIGNTLDSDGPNNYDGATRGDALAVEDDGDLIPTAESCKPARSADIKINVLTGGKLKEELKRSNADLMRVRAGGRRLSESLTNKIEAGETRDHHAFSSPGPTQPTVLSISADDKAPSSNMGVNVDADEPPTTDPMFRLTEN